MRAFQRRCTARALDWLEKENGPEAEFWVATGMIGTQLSVIAELRCTARDPAELALRSTRSALRWLPPAD